MCVFVGLDVVVDISAEDAGGGAAGTPARAVRFDDDGGGAWAKCRVIAVADAPAVNSYRVRWEPFADGRCHLLLHVFACLGQG